MDAAKVIPVAAAGTGSARQILRSSSIIGGASILNIAIGLIRTKVAALLLGPAGIGLIGLLQNLFATGGAVAGLGIGSSAVRQLAEATGDGDVRAVTATRGALFWGTAVLALFGTAAFWLLREPLARHVLGDPAQASAVGWLGLAVGLTVVNGAQIALLNGVRRIGDMARASVGGAILGTGLGIAALALWGEHGIVVYVLAAPLTGALVTGWYVRRVPRTATARPSLVDMRAQWWPMARLGVSFMLGGISVTTALLAVRAIVAQRLGPVALGHFSAAWMISMTYLGFVLQAMGTDYYPRLTAAIRDPALVNRMVNEQAEIALLLAAPILIGMEAAAPWAIRLLYSGAFAPAAEVLRWQILGDVLKIIGWPIGFVILASGNGRAFVLTETLGVGVYAVFVWLAIDRLGLPATGMGFLLMYGAYVPAVYFLARRMTGFAWTRRVVLHAAATFLTVALVAAVSTWSAPVGLLAGIMMAGAAALFALLCLDQLGGLPARLAILSSMAGQLRRLLHLKAGEERRP
ncbi:O-antigen translocase [Sphingomonas sp. CROZ-RG-20F-R02-07]|uniref:O-antigen translocase n=1 Tax=Sphingomonas sp. CROZ-RG-20F-R02-07 TaxID=2914832 RepID=UPI001F5A5ECC